jgi:hypothetical protein
MRNLNIIIKIYRWRNRSSKHWGAVQAVQSRSAPYNTVTTKPLKCFSFLFSFGSSAICYRWVIFKWLRTIPIWICLAPLPYLLFLWKHFWSIFFWNSQVFLLIFRQVLHLPWEIWLDLLFVHLGREWCCWAVTLGFGDAILKSGITDRDVFLGDNGRVITGLPIFRNNLFFLLLVLGSAELLLQYWEPWGENNLN